MIASSLLLLKRSHVINHGLRLSRSQPLWLEGRHVWRLLRFLPLQNYSDKFIIFLVSIKLFFRCLTMTYDTLRVLVVSSGVGIFQVCLRSARDQENQRDYSKNANPEERVL